MQAPVAPTGVMGDRWLRSTRRRLQERASGKACAPQARNLPHKVHNDGVMALQIVARAGTKPANFRAPGASALGAPWLETEETLVCRSKGEEEDVQEMMEMDVQCKQEEDNDDASFLQMLGIQVEEDLPEVEMGWRTEMPGAVEVAM